MTEDPLQLVKLLGNAAHRILELIAEWRGPDCEADFEDDFRRFKNSEVRQVVEDEVIVHLSKPTPLSASELVENARHQLSGVDIDSEETREIAVVKFVVVSFAEAATNHNLGVCNEGVIELDLGRWGTPESDRENLVLCDSLWQSDYFHLSAIAKPDLESRLAGAGSSLAGTLNGCCSNEAMDDAEKWMSKHITSIAKTVTYCSVGKERVATFEEEILREMRSYGHPPEGPALLSFLSEKDAKGRLVFKDCLNALAQNQRDRVDEFTRRLGYAVQMLSEADASDSAAIALVASFAAIDAVVNKKDDELGVTKQVKELIPALLMPSPNRRYIASKVLGNIYKTRNFILHKARLQCDPLESHDVRQIAAGVLRAAIEWRNARGGEPSDWEKDFIPQLRSAALNKHAMPGVPDLSELLPGEPRLEKYERPYGR